jgi:hypothetical protein
MTFPTKVTRIFYQILQKKDEEPEKKSLKKNFCLFWKKVQKNSLNGSSIGGPSRRIC